MTQYAYLVKAEEVSTFGADSFEEFYPAGHPLTRGFPGKNAYYNIGIKSEIDSNIPGCIGEWYEIDNPILHEPSLVAEYLTHYILSKDNDAIVGKVIFSRKERGEYIGILNDGSEFFRTCGQTSFLTSLEIERLEEKNAFSNVYLWQLQIKHLLPLRHFSDGK